MNPLVHEGLLNLTDDARRNQPVFSLERNGVDATTIRSGFEAACEKAEITFGQTKAGGLTWHDLRHAFATRLRGEGVHELDIMQLLGHSSLGVTIGYAHGTPAVIQNAVNKLAESTGEVLQFARAS
jgi:integrase